MQYGNKQRRDSPTLGLYIFVYNGWFSSKSVSQTVVKVPAVVPEVVTGGT